MRYKYRNSLCFDAILGRSTCTSHTVGDGMEDGGRGEGNCRFGGREGMQIRRRRGCS